MKLSRFFIAAGKVIAACFLLAIVGCSEHDEPTIPEEEAVDETYHVAWAENMGANPIELNETELNYVSSQTDFTSKLYNKLAARRSTESPNILVSPLTTYMLMSIMANGASGETQNQITQVLGFDSSDIEAMNAFNRRLANDLGNTHPLTTFNLANGAWFDKSFSVNDDFLSKCRDNYGMTATYTNLHTDLARKEINDWAAANTNNIIKDPIKDNIPFESQSVFASTLYFKSYWREPFNESNTKNGPFYNMDGTESIVPFMGTSFFIPERGVETDQYQAFPLRMLCSDYYMGIILPKIGVDLKSVMDNINLKELIVNMRSKKGVNPTWLILRLPRFEIMNSHNNLPEVLADLGIKDAFTKGKADFSNLTKEEFYIQQMKQDVKISVDENGVEAGAFDIVEGGGGGHPIMLARCNVPFAFFVYELTSESVIFIGDVTKL